MLRNHCHLAAVRRHRSGYAGANGSGKDHGMRNTGIIFVAGLMLASCGGGASQGNGTDTAAAGSGDEAAVAAKGNPVDPCSLITPAEMTAITTDAVSSATADDTTCTYHSKPDDGVALVVDATGGLKQMQVIHNTAKLLGGMGASVADKGGAGKDVSELLKEHKEEAPKLGDEAVWGMNTMLSVRQGNAFVSVTPPIMHDPTNHPGYPLVPVEEKRKIAIAVAEKALAKLPK
jgi:hypothetical protein